MNRPEHTVFLKYYLAIISYIGIVILSGLLYFHFQGVDPQYYYILIIQLILFIAFVQPFLNSIKK
jgi:hypothetical protein